MDSSDGVPVKRGLEYMTDKNKYSRANTVLKIRVKVWIDTEGGGRVK